MRKLQQLCLAGLFIVALTTATFAGDIDTGGRTEPPPPPPSATTSGEIPTVAKDDASYEYQLIEDIALELLRTMLSIF
jgi:hypothetical protein